MAGSKQGSWCHIEIPTSSPKNARKFYGNVFGWSFREIPELNYVLFTAGDGSIGGGLWDPPPGVPRMITNYVSVDDLDEMVEKVKSQGGKLVHPKSQVPGAGCFALVADPDGNVFGLWQNAATPAAPLPKAAKKKRPAPAKARKRR